MHTPYEQFSELEGLYAIVQEEVSAPTCAEPFINNGTPSITLGKLATQAPFGHQSLYVFPCQKPDDCSEPDPPLFIPFVSDKEGDELVGEFSRSASYSKSRSKCFLSRVEVRMVQNVSSLQIKMIESDALLDIPLENCQAELATQRKAELECRKVTKSTLTRSK